jgi:O-antigen/teichoic acid export membrane protein
MSESSLKRLVVHASHYSLVSIFATLAGLVSFPLFTRIFSLEDYGVMNLVAATVTVSVAFGKVGIQHSIVRYHSEISAGKSAYSLPQLYSTTFLGMAGSALVVVSGITIFTRVAPASLLAEGRLRTLLVVACIIILAQVLESAFVNLLRAEQKTTVLMKYQVAKRYLTLGFTFVAVLLIARSLFAFYWASGIAELGAVAALGYALFGRGARSRPKPSDFSRPLYRELLGFGIPMMIGYELSGIILAVGDRYVINGMMGEAPLGLYGAAYNLCQYVQGILIASVGQAIMPMYMQLWDTKGADETAAFVSKSLRSYAVLAAPVIAGLAAVGPELLPTLASDKYASAGGILPWVIAGMVFDGTTSMVGAGLFIHRKTKWIMAIVLSCAILNLAINFVLVPRIGIMGAAIATLVSYVASTLLMAVVGRSLLRVAMPWLTMLRAGVASAVMYGAVVWIHPGHRLVTIAIRVAIAIPVYAIIMVAIDGDARELFGKLLARIKRKAS